MIASVQVPRPFAAGEGTLRLSCLTYRSLLKFLLVIEMPAALLAL